MALCSINSLLFSLFPQSELEDVYQTFSRCLERVNVTLATHQDSQWGDQLVGVLFGSWFALYRLGLARVFACCVGSRPDWLVCMSATSRLRSFFWRRVHDWRNRSLLWS